MIETADMGALFKKIRLSKRLALKDVAGDYLSVSFLSKFERGESEISLSRFLYLMENMDVTIEEFYGLLAQDNPSKTEKLIGKVSQAFYKNNLLALQKYHKEEIEKYDVTSKKTYLYNAIMIESFISSISPRQIPEEHIKEITDYLFSIDQWGKRELIILGNSAPAISTSTLQVLVKEVVYRTVLFGNNESNRRTKIQLILNAIAVLLERNELELVQQNIQLLNEIGIPEICLYERVHFHLYLGIFWYKTGKKEIGRKKMELALESLKNVEAENLLISLENSAENLINSNI